MFSLQAISTGAGRHVTVTWVHAGACVCAEGYDFEKDRPTMQEPLLLLASMCGHIRVAVYRSIGRVDSQILRPWWRAFIFTHDSGDELASHALPILHNEGQASRI